VVGRAAVRASERLHPKSQRRWHEVDLEEDPDVDFSVDEGNASVAGSTAAESAAAAGSTAEQSSKRSKTAWRGRASWNSQWHDGQARGSWDDWQAPPPSWQSSHWRWGQDADSLARPRGAATWDRSSGERPEQGAWRGTWLDDEELCAQVKLDSAVVKV
jgi:hypothetical protein